MASRRFPTLSDRLTPASRARSTEQASKTLTLAELRRERHVTQVEAAALMGRPQNSVSRIERQSDVKVSTLMQFVNATGGSLRLVASYPDAEFEVVLVAGDNKRPET